MSRTLKLTIALLAAAAFLVPTAQASAEPGLRYFGYFAARLTASGGNHLPEVTGRSNLNWVQISDPNRYAPEVLDSCAPKGCIISTGFEFFKGCTTEHDPDCQLYPDYAARWGRLAEAVRSRIGKVGAFYVMDEPQWKGATPNEIDTVAKTIKATYPDIPVMMVEAGPQVSASLQVPPSVDWVGFDWYCRPFSDVQKTLATLSGRTQASQSLFLVPESAPLQACGGKAGHATDADIAPLQYDYFNLALSNPRVIGLMNFGFWTSGYGSGQLPKTVVAHQDIYTRIAGLPVSIAQKKAKVKHGRKVRVHLRCPDTNIHACAGKLSLLKGKPGRRLGSGSFAVAPGQTGTAKVKLRRHAHVGRKTKVKARADTAAGETTTKLTLRG